jgi:RNA polymerase sigma-70 factor (ECF subfamily)
LKTTLANWLAKIKTAWNIFCLLWRDEVERKDRFLLFLAQSGDLGAYDRLVIAYQGPLLQWAYFMLGGDQALAESLTRDFFIRIYRDLRVFGYPGKFSHWLYRNFILQCEKEWLRKRRAKPDLSAKRYEDNTLQFAALLVHLSLEHREVVVSHEILQLPYEEVGRILSLSVGTVKSRAHSARMRLKGLMKDHGVEKRPV